MNAPDGARARIDTGTVTAVLCTRNRPDMAATCVRRLLECDPPADEILVIDQSDGVGTRDRLRKLPGFDRLGRVIHTDSRGVSKARNLALLEATGRLVAFTDDDCLPRRDWIGAIRLAFAGCPDAIAVTGAAVPEHQEGLDERARLATTWRPPGPRLHSELVDPAEIGASFNLAVFRESALGQLGGFDERLGPGTQLPACEDTDFLFRILRLGGTVLYSPEVVASHEAWRGEAEQARTDRGYALAGGGWAALSARQGDLKPLVIVARHNLRAAVRAVGTLLTGKPHRTLHHMRAIVAACRGLLVGLGSPRERAPYMARLLVDRRGYRQDDRAG